MSEQGTLADVLSRLQLLEDERAIVATLYRYGHSLDYGMESDWLDCFTDDAIFHFLPATQAIATAFGETSRLPSRREGKVALADFVKRHSRAPGRLHKHLLMNPMITVRGDDAEARSYFMRIDASPTDTGAYITTFGRYLDSLVRGADGRWRIRRRMAEGDAFFDRYA
jgi:3-phenylpropionate/cinnamic acid dioxygenase small subunit